jgi:predicted DNA-binding transcriptional regulator
MRDFNIESYKQFLDCLLEVGFSFQTYKSFNENAYQGNLIILRHDVDKIPQNSLRFARIQAELGIQGTYYFRMVPQSYNEAIIKEIVELGHEIGYHYETMDSSKGDVDKAYQEFCKNLEKFTKITEIRTISMHGSPMSPHDNRAIWQKYNYKSLGIIAEPYFDLDFNQVYYITDTGRRWDGHLFNVRDKAIKENPLTNEKFLKLRFHSTFDLIRAIERDKFPKKAMLNFHPQRWNNAFLPWFKELVLQNLKNQVKRFLVK